MRRLSKSFGININPVVLRHMMLFFHSSFINFINAIRADKVKVVGQLAARIERQRVAGFFETVKVKPVLALVTANHWHSLVHSAEAELRFALLRLSDFVRPTHTLLQPFNSKWMGGL